MKMKLNSPQKSLLLFALTAACFIVACNKTAPTQATAKPEQADSIAVSSVDPTQMGTHWKPIVVPRDIQMKGYFEFLDSLILANDSMVNYALTEHIVVRNNAWIIDTLASYDFDLRFPKGDTIMDQKEEVMLRKGDTLWLPNDSAAARLVAQFNATLIDVNIPEFKLRIIENGVVKHTFPVRVGRDEQKFLSMAGRMASLRTPIGEGKMERLERNPLYMNPVDGKKYYATHRDNGMLTKLPRIPFMEPSINGTRPGALMHPTTNPHTLGKAYSNGCVGMSEAAAWIVYYHAPIGTAVRYRYETHIVDEKGDTIALPNIYKLKLASDKMTYLQENSAYSYCHSDTLPDGTIVHKCN
jgi:lipoprotein-anchoring transpeptidase ErfK/SrfK